jgi:hypothetical protein
LDANGVEIAGRGKQGRCGEWREQGLRRMALEKIPSEAKKTRIYIRTQVKNLKPTLLQPISWNTPL